LSHIIQNVGGWHACRPIENHMIDDHGGTYIVIDSDRASS